MNQLIQSFVTFKCERILSTSYSCSLYTSDDKYRVEVPRKTAKIPDFQRIGVFWTFLTGKLVELKIRGVEIEPHIVLL
jgi:hypothetical protein